jgi:hypothetical protein
MTIPKSFVTIMLGLICTAVGAWLRLAARDLAWPSEWSYTGPRESTLWAIREHAYQDLALSILGFGLLIIMLVLAKWLWSLPANGKQER